MAGTNLAGIESVYKREFSRYLRVATAIVREEERAYDVVQEAFATAIRERRRFKGEGPLQAWIWRIVVNGARKAAAARRPDAPYERPRDASDDVADVRAAVAGLPERQRLILFLRYYADLDYRGIAEVLGIRTGTVGASLNAAHASLRSVLQEVQSCTKS